MQVALRWTSGIPFLGLDVVIARPRQRSPQCATSGFTCSFEAAGPTAAITVSVYIKSGLRGKPALSCAALAIQLPLWWPVAGDHEAFV